VTQHQEPLNVADVRQDPRNYALGEDESVRAELAVPIQTAREVFGALAVMSDVQATFDTNDLRLLTTLASQLGVALDNSRLFATEKRRVRQLSQVNHLSVAITAQIDPTENLQIAADAIAAIFGIERCAIVVHGGDQTRPSRIAPRMRPPVALGARLHFAPPAEHIARALNLREPLLIRQVANDERLARLYASLEQEGIESLALVPLLSSSRLVGTMVLDATGRIDQFGHAELTLLETVASLIAQVIENARLYRQVEDERSTLNAVLDGAADPIMLIGPQEQLLLANRAAAEQLGIDSTGEQPVTALIEHRELLQALHLKNGPLASNGLSPEVTLPDGETFSISVAPVQGADNETLGRVAVMQNITAIKELERREQERLRSVFGRYVSAQVVEQVLAGGGDFGEPVERDVVVIFADLRGYTTLTEGMEPRVLVEQVLNRYFTAMTDVFYRYEGTVDKFLGDGIIGVFGTPIAHADDLPRSLCAAVDLQRAFADLHHDWQQAIGLDIGLGIGIGYGRAVVGNIGSSQRLDYTVIGDVVNTANRLNGQAASGQIIVSYHLIDSLPPSWTPPWPLRPLSRVSLKGKQEPHLIYEVMYT
jgi:adenylate cyclase